MKETTSDSMEQEKSSEGDELAGKYLTFQLGEERYGLFIRPIDDIIEIKEITEVPQTSEYLKGVINLRGTVIPALDLRSRFEMAEREYDERTCIIVVTLDDLQTGLIVDRVSEVVKFNQDDIEPSPNMGNEISNQFIAGMGKQDDQVVILLDLENILTEEETDELREVSDEKS